MKIRMVLWYRTGTRASAPWYVLRRRTHTNSTVETSVVSGGGGWLLDEFVVQTLHSRLVPYIYIYMLPNNTHTHTNTNNIVCHNNCNHLKFVYRNL
jgi:hypothetical protein